MVHKSQVKIPSHNTASLLRIYSIFLLSYMFYIYIYMHDDIFICIYPCIYIKFFTSKINFADRFIFSSFSNYAKHDKIIVHCSTI